jgi:hypothetical protein
VRANVPQADEITDARTRGIRVLTHEELERGDVSLSYVSKLMNRSFPNAPLIRKVLQTIWYQVNSGQEIYVVGWIQDDATVRGGTGWGAEFAKLCNKPLFVFDQAGGLVPWSGEASPGGRRHPAPARAGRDALPRGERQKDRGALRPLVRPREVRSRRHAVPTPRLPERAGAKVRATRGVHPPPPQEHGRCSGRTRGNQTVTTPETVLMHLLYRPSMNWLEAPVLGRPGAHGVSPRLELRTCLAQTLPASSRRSPSSTTSSHSAPRRRPSFLPPRHRRRPPGTAPPYREAPPELGQARRLLLLLAAATVPTAIIGFVQGLLRGCSPAVGGRRRLAVTGAF